MKKDKKNLWITILSIIVFALLLVLIYFFIVQPSIESYVLRKQVEAQSFVFADMVNQLQNQGFYRVTLQNQTIVLVPVQQ